MVMELYPAAATRQRGFKQMSIRSTIMSQFVQVAEEQEVEPPALSDELVLLDSGLDSLGFAILVARLEDTLGFDPFSTSDEIFFPVTLGDFVRVYEDAAAKLEVAS
jgi:acyl carrier protein